MPNDSEESSTSIDFEDEGYNINFIKKIIFTECKLKVPDYLIERYIKLFEKKAYWEEYDIAKKFIPDTEFYNQGNYDVITIQDLINTQSKNLLKKLLKDSGWYLLFYTGEQTEDIFEILKKSKRPSIEFVIDQTEEFCLKMLKLQNCKKNVGLVFNGIKNQTKDICNYALRYSEPFLIWYIDDKSCITEKTYTTLAYKHGLWCFDFLPPTYIKTKNFYINICASNRTNYRYNDICEIVPKEFQDLNFFKDIFKHRFEYIYNEKITDKLENEIATIPKTFQKEILRLLKRKKVKVKIMRA